MKIKPVLFTLLPLSMITISETSWAKMSFYAQLDQGVEKRSSDAADKFGYRAFSYSRVRDFDSHFGIKGETKLGYGLRGWGRIETALQSSPGFRPPGDRDAIVLSTESPSVVGDTFRVRERVVGLDSRFGSFYVGQTFHTFYKHIMAPADLSFATSQVQTSLRSYKEKRSHSGISYAQDFYLGDIGKLSIGATAYYAPLCTAAHCTGVGQALPKTNINTAGTTNSAQYPLHPMDKHTSKTLDRWEVALSFDAGPFRLGFGIDDTAAAPDTHSPVTLPSPGGSTTLIDLHLNNYSKHATRPIYGLSFATEIGDLGLSGNYLRQSFGQYRVNVRGYGGRIPGGAISESFTLHLSWQNFYLHTEKSVHRDMKKSSSDPQEDSINGRKSPISLAVGYHYLLGKQASFWFEFESYDASEFHQPAYDSNYLRAALRYKLL